MFSFHSVARTPALLFGVALVSGVVALGALLDELARDPPPSAAAAAPAQVRHALDRAQASQEVTRLAQWVVASRDHAGRPFLIVDKLQARLFAFDAHGRLLAGTAVLLGAARSDDAEPAATPAGRFVTDLGPAAPEARLAWVNGQARLQLHGTPSVLTPGRAAWRLASASAEDKRISDGSLHVPPEFFRDHLHMLRNRLSIAYVLPETAQALRVVHAPDRRHPRRPS